jgi:hypothetical protein
MEDGTSPSGVVCVIPAPIGAGAVRVAGDPAARLTPYRGRRGWVPSFPDGDISTDSCRSPDGLGATVSAAEYFATSAHPAVSGAASATGEHLRVREHPHVA